jgi:hypothetical protein
MYIQSLTDNYKGRHLVTNEWKYRTAATKISTRWCLAVNSDIFCLYEPTHFSGMFYNMLGGLCVRTLCVFSRSTFSCTFLLGTGHPISVTC